MASSAIVAKKKEWTACLAQSKGAPARCEKLEKDLASMSKASGIECCVAETVALMRCTGSSSKATGCGSEFLAMRECNRSAGRELVKNPEGTAYAVAPNKSSLFTSSAWSLVSSVAPTRTLQGMTDFGEDYAKTLHISEVRF
mmetsp:Transcript_29739/g.44858  ORF Transcript_29739/g.44858 Transcript_29739/m.44858 type:complete len:142 (+) Transcript_29739:93-518(+)|eukprot:CAMPEP_0194763038 /NCGR_PEP_ID=MMETSP0323_2-20130528/17797_1 /TAXON_ID=2866 ORGANISM="Crypthecodinium cohnii, Strain Seligo" /NCGR_SAMPLE_ID=MMETSP0323_2 /ASSEMBLY_ACC=CAM_ASM_000346 /LENGTH=141 /DNA_ID=CAMNT_0039686917 /DNA_START=59 /DNA_END=484 /DNA_ORIENTATION=+